MKYYSLNGQSPLVNFKDAAIRGIAPDKGLYFPVTIPKIDPTLLREIESTSDADLAFKIIHPYIADTIQEEQLYKIVAETISFPIPLLQITQDIFALELFHGPTLAFKDIGARFMSRCLSEFVKEGAAGQKKVVVLVATSGDTGGAVANGFYGQEGIDVVILYPSGKVSPVQEMQLTALGKNIHALEVQGSFDDCQAMVKKAFADDQVNERIFLTSANSINVARWLPQQFYYFLAYKQWKDKSDPPVISVPSGNLGNLSAGMLACASGLPVKHFIAACNENDSVVKYLSSGHYFAQPVRNTYSNAMDVGDPSNINRLLELFERQHHLVFDALTAYTVTDAETLQIIENVYHTYGYTLDPHGAVGFKALQNYLSDHPGKGFFLETAHPVKFPAVVEKATASRIKIPSDLNAIMLQQKKSVLIDTSYHNLKNYLLEF